MERNWTSSGCAIDWQWLFISPELGLASVNELVIPVGVPVHFSLTADAPMNSFWIPSLGGMIMVMPGMETQLNLAADTPGTFEGTSGNLSGTGFSRMTFKTRALPPDQFEAWTARVKAETETPLDGNNYNALAKQSEANPVVYYYPVDAGLYTAIHAKYMDAELTTEHSEQAI